MSIRHISNKTANDKLGSKEGQRKLLCRNKAVDRCPFLEFDPNAPDVPDEVALEYLADIVVAIFLDPESPHDFSEYDN